MPGLAVRKITKELFLKIAASSLPEDEVKANAAAIADVCDDIGYLFHENNLKREVLSAFVGQGMCLECLALWGFRLGVACVNEQILQDRLEAALATTEDSHQE